MYFSLDKVLLWRQMHGIPLDSCSFPLPTQKMCPFYKQSPPPVLAPLDLSSTYKNLTENFKP